VLPVIGSKELVAWLPTLLGAGRVGFPLLAYPTYAVGARLAGAVPVATADPAAVDLLWINSPANPTGGVLPCDELRGLVAAARRSGSVVASDECYADIYYDGEPPHSVLSPEVSDGDHRGLLAVHSLSKRDNMAGYRAGFVAGDPELVAELLELRRHAGMIVPAPVQAAMVAALDDDRHAGAQRSIYGWRREQLAAALLRCGFSVSGEAGLYLWATRDEPGRETVSRLADQGILVAPGDFYGVAGERHVRVALTATDERIAAAVSRLGG
jgi:succinyldiaminopimelate transaminase